MWSQWTETEEIWRIEENAQRRYDIDDDEVKWETHTRVEQQNCSETRKKTTRPTTNERLAGRSVNKINDLSRLMKLITFCSSSLYYAEPDCRKETVTPTDFLCDH